MQRALGLVREIEALDPSRSNNEKRCGYALIIPNFNHSDRLKKKLSSYLIAAPWRKRERTRRTPTFGMLIPAGIPDPAKDRTSRLVKSGLKNLSFSKSFDQGSLGITDSAPSTNLPNARVRSRLTVAANPSFCQPIRSNPTERFGFSSFKPTEPLES